MTLLHAGPFESAVSELTLSVAAPTVKPNPPSNVVVQQEEGQETRMTVTWGLPTSWNSQGNFFKLIFELKYRPRVSSFHYEQVRERRCAVGFPCFLCVCVYISHSFSHSMHFWLFHPKTHQKLKQQECQHVFFTFCLPVCLWP